MPHIAANFRSYATGCHDVDDLPASNANIGKTIVSLMQPDM